MFPCCVSNGKVGDGRTRNVPHQVDFRHVLDYRLVGVIIPVPEKAEVGLLAFGDGDLMEHVLYVGGDGMEVAAETGENPSERIFPVGTLKEGVV